MWIDIFWTVLGLVLILVGANALTDGSSSIAKRMGISDLIIGLTVVALGTSTPELIITILAAINGNTTLAIGNIVGSNTLNILLVIGATAAITPIIIERTVMTIEIPIVILSALVLLIIGNSSLLDPDSQNVITRVDGIFLLITFALYVRHTIQSAKNDVNPGTQDTSVNQMSTAKSILYIVAGLAALIWGGDKFVDGASAVASSLGVSDAVIGLTVVAIGTSLPELAASIVAAIKGKPELAVGNVIGSNIFNVFFVLGVSSTIAPLPFGAINNVDLLTGLGASILFLLFGWLIKTRTITRGEGIVMVTLYIAYTVWLVINA